MAEEPTPALPPPPTELARRRRLKLALAIVAIVACVAFALHCRRYKIPTGSMEPSLLIGDHIVTARLDMPWSGDARSSLQRGDIVAFRYPEDLSREFLMRVIALPGETVRIVDNRVIVNGRELDEPYAMFTLSPNEISDGHDNLPDVTVPGGYYFVLGDNRDASHDSRYWGFLPSELVTGRALFVYWSYDAPYSGYTKTGAERLKEVLSILPLFFSNTRWDRFFHNLSAR